MSDLEQDPASDVVFDTSSGISLEEQQEILAGINAMSSGSRLVPDAAADAVVNAKKKGFLFPLLVNIAAGIVLALGFIFLFLLQGQEEQGIRENSTSLGITERKMIQEIRQETNQLLGEKEKEINGILSKLRAADAEQKELQNSVESLTEEQKARVAALLLLQEEYRSTLSFLEDEKASIIEDSMQKEARLRSLAEEKAAALSSQIEQSQASLGSAMEELRQLGREQERANRMEDQMAGFYRTLNSQVRNSDLDLASGTLAAMKDFLNAPVFQGSARKQAHLAAINAMEGALTGHGGVVAVVPQDTSEMEIDYSALNARYAVLEQRAADQAKALNAFSSQASDQGNLIAEYVTEISALNARTVNQQETLNRRDSEIVNLRTENVLKDQQINALNTNAAALRGQLQTANNSVSEGEAALAQLRRENTELLAQREELQRQYDDLQRRMDAAFRAAMGE